MIDAMIHLQYNELIEKQKKIVSKAALERYCMVVAIGGPHMCLFFFNRKFDTLVKSPFYGQLRIQEFRYFELS